MATIREWLTAEGFDFSAGRVYVQPVSAACEYLDPTPPGWASSDEIGGSVPATDADLDREFSSCFGSPQAPRFIAYDPTAVYFPAQYDGATWCEKVFLDPAVYTDSNHPTPYPGG